MIFKLKFDDKFMYAQAKHRLHLLHSYASEYDDSHELLELTVVSEEEAKNIMLVNPDYDPNDPDDMKEFTLFDSVTGEDFAIIGSTEWI